MSNSSRPAADAAARFFDNYLTLLHKKKIPEKQRRWYVRHIERFIKSQNGHKIKALSGAEVSAYLDVLGRHNRLNGWQFAQHVDAIQILYCDLLATEACQLVDWPHWLNAARALDAEHPTLARRLSPEELSYIKERKGTGPLQQVRAQHHDVLVFLYKQVLDTHLGQLEDFVRAKRSHNLPVVLSRAEVDCLLAKMDGIHKLLAALLYGTGMRLLEAVRLRVQDIDFANHRIHVHQAKGKKDRYVPLNDDLYPCPQPARRGCIQPTGPTAHGEVSVR